MSNAIYKPISWEDAAREIRENNGKRLFIEIENGDLNRADCFRLEVGKLMAESWYLRCEQKLKSNALQKGVVSLSPKTLADVCIYRPEVSE